MIQNKKPGILEGADCASRVAGGEKTKQAIVQEWLLDGKVLTVHPTALWPGCHWDISLAKFCISNCIPIRDLTYGIFLGLLYS